MTFVLNYATILFAEKGDTMEDIDIKLGKEKLIQTIKRVINNKNFRTIENSILDKNDAFLSYLFAKEIEGADIPSHLNVVLNSEDYQTIYTFAMEIKCDKKGLQNKITKHGDARWIYYLAWAENIDFESLQEALFNTGNIDYIFNFGLNFDNADKQKITEMVIASRRIDLIAQLGRYGVNFYQRERIISEIQEENIRSLRRNNK